MDGQFPARRLPNRPEDIRGLNSAVIIRSGVSGSRARFYPGFPEYGRRRGAAIRLKVCM